MPNLEVFRAQEEKAIQSKEKSTEVQAELLRRERLVSRYEIISELFGQPGWAELKAHFAELKELLEKQILTEEPLSNELVQTLRIQLVYANKLLNLDFDTFDTLKSLKDSIKALTGKLADAQGLTGAAHSGEMQRGE